MFEQRDRNHPTRPNSIAAAITEVLSRLHISGSEQPFIDLGPGMASRIAAEIRASTGLPFVSAELHPYRSVRYVISLLYYRAHVLALERDIAEQRLTVKTEPRCGALVGDYQISDFFGHAGLSALYRAKERGTNEDVLLAIPLRSLNLPRLLESVPRGFYGYVPAEGVIASIVSGSAQDATVNGSAQLIRAVYDLEHLRYQGNCKGLSLFHIREGGGGLEALVFRTGPVYSLRHHLQLRIGFKLSVFSTLAAQCQRIGGHGNLSPESLLLSDGSLRAVINPSVNLFDGHFFTSCWEYNPFRRVGAAADVCAIGVMLYENFAGKRPFGAPFVPYLADNAREFELSAYTAFPNPSEASPLLKPDLERIILRCLRDSSYDLKQLGADLDSYIMSFGEDTKSL